MRRWNGPARRDFNDPDRPAVRRRRERRRRATGFPRRIPRHPGRGFHVPWPLDPWHVGAARAVQRDGPCQEQVVRGPGRRASGATGEGPTTTPDRTTEPLRPAARSAFVHGSAFSVTETVRVQPRQDDRPTAQTVLAFFERLPQPLQSRALALRSRLFPSGLARRPGVLRYAEARLRRPEREGVEWAAACAPHQAHRRLRASRPGFGCCGAAAWPALAW